LKKITIVYLSVLAAMFCGCAHVPASARKKLSADNTALQQQELRIQELEKVLAERDLQIKEKDARIQQLKDKLRSLGVF
jgi:hypothetical protein